VDESTLPQDGREIVQLRCSRGLCFQPLNSSSGAFLDVPPQKKWLPRLRKPNWKQKKNGLKEEVGEKKKAGGRRDGRRAAPENKGGRCLQPSLVGKYCNIHAVKGKSRAVVGADAERSSVCPTRACLGPKTCPKRRDQIPFGEQQPSPTVLTV
jgi:hypothetical protein